MLGAIGVVYGDIGTSPLYAMRETVMAATGGHHGTHVPITREQVIAAAQSTALDTVFFMKGAAK